ncbi:MAG: TetR/AcrR family transcriptional regulator [Ktedonobacteraceae bacterium]
MPRGQHKHSVHEEETRTTILRTAQQLFMEHGYRAVSTRQIADACGLTQPALYHHFSDKQDLYVAVMKESLLQTQAALERIARRSESVQERLKRVVRYLLSHAQHDHTLMMHDIRQELSVTSRTVLNEAFQVGIITPICSLFEEGIQQGVLRDQQHGGIDTTTATHLFMSMLSQFLAQDVQQAVHAQRDIAQRERAEEIIVQLMFHGLATAHPEHS